MNDRALSSHPPLTPSQRVIELTQEVTVLQDRLAAAEARLRSTAPARYRTFTGTSFGGVTMAQYWCDLVLWEAVLNENPDLRAVIEIGTWQGGLSWWLDAQCRARAMAFRTFDAVEPIRRPPNFRRVDVFAEADAVAALIHEWQPLAVFCDGGNKPREMQLFAPHLTDPASLLLVHDWGTETVAADVPAGLTMAYGAFCDELGGITRVFRPSVDD